MSNYWASKKNPFVYWHIVFPNELVKSDPSILVHFAKEFCLLCEEYEIFQLQRISNRIATWNQEDKPYSEHLHDMYKSAGKIPFFYDKPVSETEIDKKQLIAPTKICFTSSDGLLEKHINDLGNLLDELDPSIDQIYKFHAPPVSVRGGIINPNEIDLNRHLHPIAYLSISLHSDIWLPFTFNSRGDSPAGELISNEAIAKAHTQRFNVWLDKVKVLSIKLGAYNEFDGTEAPEKYKPMLSESGINLDYKPTDIGVLCISPR